MHWYCKFTRTDENMKKIQENDVKSLKIQIFKKCMAGLPLTLSSSETVQMQSMATILNLSPMS